MNKPHPETDPKIKDTRPNKGVESQDPVPPLKPPPSHQPRPEIIEACFKGTKPETKILKSKSRLAIGRILAKFNQKNPKRPKRPN